MQIIKCKKINNNIFIILKELTYLKILSLQCCYKIDNKCIEYINLFPKLYYLDLSGCNIILSDVKNIFNSKIKYIDIRPSVLYYNNLKVQNKISKKYFTVFY